MQQTGKKREPNIDHGFHASIPRMVRTEYKDITPTQKWIYVCLKDLCGDTGTCYRTLRVLSEETSISTGMLSESIPALHKAGLIHAEKKKRTTGGKEVWHITIVDIWAANGKLHPSKRSQREQTISIVQDVNDNVHNVNENTDECSQDERERSQIRHRSNNTGSTNNIEDKTVEETTAKAVTPTVKNFPEWMVTKAEELRKKPYTETQQAKEVAAAKKVLARKPDLTQDQFIQVFNKRNDEWWQEHVGLLNVTHLAATPKDQNDIRFMLVLEQITRQPTLFPGASNGTGATTNQRSHNLLPELQAAKVNARNYRKSAEIRRKRGDIAGAEEAEQDAIEYEAEVERLSQQEQQIA